MDITKYVFSFEMLSEAFTAATCSFCLFVRQSARSFPCCGVCFLLLFAVSLVGLWGLFGFFVVVASAFL